MAKDTYHIIIFFFLHFPAQWVTSKVGSKMLLFKDFVYYCHNTQKCSEMWYCVTRSAGRCRASLKVTSDGIFVREPKHNHPPSTYAIHNGVYHKLH